jgi:hypothetical protein
MPFMSLATTVDHRLDLQSPLPDILQTVHIDRAIRFIFSDMVARPFHIFPMTLTVEGTPLPASLCRADLNNSWVPAGPVIRGIYRWALGLW